MPELVIPRGIPGSGKTTAAVSWRAEDDHRVIVSRDDLRLMLGFWPRGNKEQEDALTKVETDIVSGYLDADFSVWVDAMHLKKRYVNRWQKFAHEKGIPLSIRDFEIDVDEAVRRDANREKSIGEAAVRSIAADNLVEGKLPFLREFHYPEKRPAVYVPNRSKPHAYIVDIDGTVASHVLPDGTPIRGHFDYSRVYHDIPRYGVIHLVHTLYEAGNRIIFLSGREVSCYEDTVGWLYEHFDDEAFNFELHMRSTGDYRPDYVIKLELFNEFIRDNYCVIGAIDDRLQVAKLWYELGLEVYRVGDPEAVF